MKSLKRTLYVLAMCLLLIPIFLALQILTIGGDR